MANTDLSFTCTLPMHINHARWTGHVDIKFHDDDIGSFTYRLIDLHLNKSLSFELIWSIGSPMVIKTHPLADMENLSRFFRKGVPTCMGMNQVLLEPFRESISVYDKPLPPKFFYARVL